MEESPCQDSLWKLTSVTLENILTNAIRSAEVAHGIAEREYA